jgi:hypothetical protein
MRVSSSPRRYKPPELVAFEREQGFVPTFAPPERVRARVVEETPRWAEIIRAANPQLD